ncbi:hypothetical protein [Arthrobacter sp. NIO-1057]|uniref:hypothetical protein n=1 Tax=Arthrobacter sp. NIO-1057 TaxID=993071 RepID=UPI00071C3B77|nr:hypothetical protein [Arthrobacter sp. NIO-1057]KSU65992.1 hypothetical protein AS038_09925 [Arthrobacter sp. NIO-1057]SCC29387.1 hypothetical protein GA0061084_2020 [Arthrobacter sp. NIO-1057]
MTDASSMILKFNRPQYVSIPEGFVSALAWQCFDVENSHLGADPVGRIYRSIKTSTSKRVRILETTPERESLSAFGRELALNGITVEAVDAEVLAQAVSNSVSGIQSEKGTIQAASPLTPTFALMQDMRGIQGTRNPPDLGGILDDMYQYGIPLGSESQPSASALWLRAAKQRCDQDPLLAAMDDAIRKLTFSDTLSPLDPASVLPIADFSGTPFVWFQESWSRLTSESWVSALPARVWADWATTVLRMSFAMGFLWEATWYVKLAKSVVSGDLLTWQESIKSVGEILPWRSMRSSTSVRDIAAHLSWTVHQGAVVREQLSNWDKSGIFEDLSFDDALAMMHSDEEYRTPLKQALSNRQKNTRNIQEAIRYTLKTRDRVGETADYYGLLRSSGRYLTVDPGTEWITVVASLTCRRPGTEANVGDLMENLQLLGLYPELADVVDLLERAGLARGSADADQGVRIQSAF